jgi:hypothetical protein
VAKITKRKNVKVIDRGWKKIQKEFLRAADGEAVTIGIQGDKALKDEHDGLTNVRLGAIHEFGTDDGRIPERSHFRSTFDKNVRKYSDELVDAARRISSGESPIGEMILLGEMARKDILDAIKKGIRPRLKPATIARKRGETTPLINWGIYWNSISYEKTTLDKVDRSGF